MSDADDQLGGSGDSSFDQPAQSQEKDDERAERALKQRDENDNDVTTDDDLPSGG